MKRFFKKKKYPDGTGDPRGKGTPLGPTPSQVTRANPTELVVSQASPEGDITGQWDAQDQLDRQAGAIQCLYGDIAANVLVGRIAGIAAADKDKLLAAVFHVVRCATLRTSPGVCAKASSLLRKHDLRIPDIKVGEVVLCGLLSRFRLTETYLRSFPLLEDGIDYRSQIRVISPTISRKGRTITTQRMVGPAATGYLPDAEATFLCLRLEENRSIPTRSPDPHPTTPPVLPSPSHPFQTDIMVMMNRLELENKDPDGTGEPGGKGAPTGPTPSQATVAKPEEAVSQAASEGNATGSPSPICPPTSAEPSGSGTPSGVPEPRRAEEVSSGKFKFATSAGSREGSPMTRIPVRFAAEAKGRAAPISPAPRKRARVSLGSASAGGSSPSAKAVAKRCSDYCTRLRDNGRISYDHLDFIKNAVDELVALAEGAHVAPRPSVPQPQRPCKKCGEPKRDIVTQTTPPSKERSSPGKQRTPTRDVASTVREILLSEDFIARIAREVARLAVPPARARDPGPPLPEGPPGAPVEAPGSAREGGGVKKKKKRKKKKKPAAPEGAVAPSSSAPSSAPSGGPAEAPRERRVKLQVGPSSLGRGRKGAQRKLRSTPAGPVDQAMEVDQGTSDQVPGNQAAGKDSWATVVKRGRKGPKPKDLTKAAVLKAVETKASAVAKPRPLTVRVRVQESIAEPQARQAALLTAMENLIAPESLGNVIRGVRSARPGEILIAVGTRDQAKALAESEMWAPLGLTTSVTGPRLPRVVVTGVPRNWEGERLASEMRGCGVIAEGSVFRPLFKRGDRDLPLSQWVVETDARDSITAARIKIRGWLTLRAYDFVDQPRCFRCQVFGHTAKKCGAKVSTCGWCGRNGHNFKNCPDKEAGKRPTCINCHKIKADSKHHTGDAKCTAYLRYLQRSVRRTAYGKAPG